MKKQFRITLNGKTFDVVAEILDESGAPVSAAPAAAKPRRSPAAQVPGSASAPPPKSAPAPAGSGEVPSPLAGKVVSIDAPVGTAVKAGDKILTLEAMKMNTVVSSPVDGTVQAVQVNPGDSVEEGQALMSIA